MLGSGPDDGDIIEMSPGKSRLSWLIGSRSRLVLVVGSACLLVAAGSPCLLAAAGAAVAVVRLSSSAPANPLPKLITEVTTVPVSEMVPSPTTTVISVGAAFGSTAAPAQ